MLLPTIHGVIRRRLLVNFRGDPEVVQRLLPAPFRPALHDGAAIAGVCLIRLEQLRPRPLPAAMGLNSENAAHRVAVRWTTPDGEERQGVYIPRRDSSSWINYLSGGRLLPGEHHRATFAVVDRDGAIDLAMRSLDGEVSVHVRGRRSSDLPRTSTFSSLQAASDFFERGAHGYSDKARGDRLDGVRLVTRRWQVDPFAVEHVQSSFFSDPALFPAGSVEFDCALLMRDIDHEWQGAPELPAASSSTGS